MFLAGLSPIATRVFRVGWPWSGAAKIVAARVLLPRARCCPGAVAKMLLLPRCCAGRCQLFSGCCAGSYRHAGLAGAVAN